MKTDGIPGLNIRSFGPYVKTHRRHFLQQADYTIAIEYRDGEWQLGSHEAGINGRDGKQDAIWKLTMPTRECQATMSMLDSFNVNEFSLFGTEDALVQTQWNRESIKDSLD